MFLKKKRPSVPEQMDVPGLLFEAKTSDDPVYAHDCLMQAESLAPDNIEVQRAILMLGRLHERTCQGADFSVIKCYLLHSLEHPEKYTDTQLKQKAEELFQDDRLLRCLSLSSNPQAFLDSYLMELAEDYMRLFIAGDSSHAPRVFGFSAKTLLHSYLAKPTSDLISNTLLSPYLTQEQQRLVARSFYQAFSRQMGGETKTLDKLLGAEICRVIA